MLGGATHASTLPVAVDALGLSVPFATMHMMVRASDLPSRFEMLLRSAR